MCLEILIDVGVEVKRVSRNTELNQAELVPFLQTLLVPLNIPANSDERGFGMLSFSNPI